MADKLYQDQVNDNVHPYPVVDTMHPDPVTVPPDLVTDYVHSVDPSAHICAYAVADIDSTHTYLVVDTDSANAYLEANTN